MRIERPSFLSSMVRAVMKIFIQTPMGYENIGPMRAQSGGYLVLTN
jgi:hypothetical protein